MYPVDLRVYTRHNNVFCFLFFSFFKKLLGPRHVVVATMELYGWQLLKIWSQTKFSRCSFPHTGYSIPYCILGREKITDVGTLSFRWILPFWYFCLKTQYKARLALCCVCNQKYQKRIIHRKLRVPTSEREGKPTNPRGRAARARRMEKIYGNLRKPAHARRARTTH